MKKYEFIMNEAIAEDFLFLCEKYNVGKHYTKIDGVKGCGFQNPKMGDDVWPQLNIMFVVVDEDTTLQTYGKIVGELRNEFPEDGIFCNVCDCTIM